MRDVVADVAWTFGVRAAILNRAALQAADEMHLFNTVVAPKMKAADQRFSGRCWAFAGLNLLRRNLAKRWSLPPEFELSQSFVLYCDKYERANAFLHKLLELMSQRAPNSNGDSQGGARVMTPETANDRVVVHLLADPITDGGTWSTFVALVTKHGVVPHAAMRESTCANDTWLMNRTLKLVLLKAVATMRGCKTHADAMDEISRAMSQVSIILDACLGAPPNRVTWSYTANDVVRTDTDRAPIDLFRECDMGLDIKSWQVLCHLPSYPQNRSFHVAHMDTVMHVKNAFLNVDIETMRTAIKNAIGADKCVWFACEFDEQHDSQDGLLHHELMHMERVVGTYTFPTLAERINARAVNIDHAMLFTGMHRLDDTVARWQVENSHGDVTREGYLSMTDEWLRAHVLYVAVPATVQEDKFEKCTLQPWDVLGNVLYRR